MRFMNVMKRVRINFRMDNIPDMFAEGMEGETTTEETGEGTGSESSGYCGKREETVRIVSVKRQQYEMVFQSLTRRTWQGRLLSCFGQLRIMETDINRDFRRCSLRRG